MTPSAYNASPKGQIPGRKSTAGLTPGSYLGETSTFSKHKRNEKPYDDRSPSSRAFAARFCKNLRAASAAAAKNRTGASTPGSGSKRKRGEFMIYNDYPDVYEDAYIDESPTKKSKSKPKRCDRASTPKMSGGIPTPNTWYETLFDLSLE